MFRMKQKVKILSSKKTDGRFNYGRIVGIELLQNGYYLSYKNEKEFIARFDGKSIKYTLAFIDCVTERAMVRKYQEKDLSND